MGEQKTVVYMGGKQAGCVGMLTLLALGYKVMCVVAYDDLMRDFSIKFDLPLANSIKDKQVVEMLGNSDLLVSCHGRQIVPIELLRLPKLGCINAHPCLYRYKGADPVNRMLNDGCSLASVGVHRMTEVIDGGEVLSELYVDVAGSQTAVEVYNKLYPYYAIAIMGALKKL